MSGRVSGTGARASRVMGAVVAGRGLALFAEVIVVALLVALCSLPVVTALPAFAAGARHIRRHAAGEEDGVMIFARDLLTAVRGGWPWGVVTGGAGAAIVVNATADFMGAVPGGGIVRVLSLVVAAAGVVTLLRASAAWEPGAAWSRLVPDAARAAVADLPGTLLLALAVGLTVLIVWMFAPLAVLAPGLLLLGAVAVHHRAR